MRFIFNHNNYTLSGVRINTLQGVIFFLILAIVGRLFYLQVLKNNYYTALGAEQRSIIRDISPERGRIYAQASETSKDLYPLAVNKVYYEVNINPSIITRPQNIADILAEVLEFDEEEKNKVSDKVKKDDDQYELIAKEVNQEKVDILKQRLEELRFDINKGRTEEDQLKTIAEVGVDFEKTVLRYYPDKEIGAHILGFLGYGEDINSRVGRYGIEGYYQNDLAGYSGKIVGEADLAGRLLTDDAGNPVTNGADIILTIDRNVEYQACKALERAVVRYEADNGTVVIMDTKTGAIKAMCNYPSFDPNDYGQVEDINVYNNNAVYSAYEPGSVMKVISMAIAIDQGKVSPDSLYEDKGEIKFSSGQVIKNSDLKAHGLVDMKEVLASSLNTGIVFATSEINNKIFEEFMKKFGFGQETNIAISQDSVGNISSLSKKGDIYKATASYGQGITVSPLQMLNSVNTIANKGKMVQPYIVSSIEYGDGNLIEFEPKVLREVISKSTASQVSAMMVHVVDSGHATKAGVEGYYVAGKTGTAQVANPETGKYYTDRTIHSFVGFAPNDNPKFTMIIKLENPKAASFSSDTAAPLFGEIAKYLLEYYQIPPNR